MRLTICHQEVGGGASPDELDTLSQVETVRQAVLELGAEVEVLPCGLDLGRIEARLRETRPDIAFNLVESLAGRGQLISVVPSLLEVLGVRYTGTPADGLYLSSNKLLAKQRLRACGVPIAGALQETQARRFVVKSVWEHASLGLDAESVVPRERVAATIAEREARFHGHFFAEEYVPGREFNVALLESPAGPEVLPIAEIAFEGLSATEPRIVDYSAKWDPSSEEYASTPRAFVDAERENRLCARLSEIALDAWRALGLAGYARVDLRVDGERCAVIDVNANPCIAPDAGFAAALARAKIPLPRAIERLLARAALASTGVRESNAI